jgi:hypothetical protein
MRFIHVKLYSEHQNLCSLLGSINVNAVDDEMAQSHQLCMQNTQEINVVQQFLEWAYA